MMEYFWRWPQRFRLLLFGLYVKPRILGPLASPTTRAATVAPPSWPGPARTESPSTSRTGVKLTSAPDAPTRSTFNFSPSATLYCFPPVFMTAYIGGQL